MAGEIENWPTAVAMLNRRGDLNERAVVVGACERADVAGRDIELARGLVAQRKACDHDRFAGPYPASIAKSGEFARRLAGPQKSEIVRLVDSDDLESGSIRKADFRAAFDDMLIGDDIPHRRDIEAGSAGVELQLS